jgi:hypothetical protein
MAEGQRAEDERSADEDYKDDKDDNKSNFITS